MVEGGNKEVSDPLDNLKEELRIAQEELKKLETPKEKNKKITVKYGDWSNIPDGKTTQYKNGNVLIQINNNSQDIYATLRSELEHARDFVKGEVPDQNLQHFSRYEGMNEAEVAPSYTYKKSKGKASKTGVDTSIREEEPLQNVMKDRQTLSDDLQLNKENINGQRTDKNLDTGNEISRGETRADGQSDRTISGHNNQRSNGTRLFIRRDNVWVIDSNSKNVFNNDKTSKVSYKELSQDVESGNSFYNAISQAKADLGNLGASVHTYTPEEYSQMRCFT